MHGEANGCISAAFIAYTPKMKGKERLQALSETSFDCTEFTEFFWTFPIVLYSKKHDVSETGSVSVLR
jgi:hypothetical protein